MAFSRTSTLRLIRTIGIALVAVLIIGYAVWRSFNYARGPRVNIFEPVDGAALSTSTVVVRGRAERVNSISLNGNPLSMDESGDFTQILAVFPGLNILTFVAEDQFGRDTETTLTLMGLISLPTSSPRLPEKPVAATTTP